MDRVALLAALALALQGAPAAAAPPADAEALSAELDRLVAGGRWPEAVAAGERALPAVEASGEAQLLTHLLAQLATACGRTGDNERAIAHLGRLVELQEWTHPGAITHVENLTALARLLRERSRPAEAERAAERAVAHARKLGAAEGPARLLDALLALAGARLDGLRFTEAEAPAREALELAGRVAPGALAERDAVRAVRDALLFSRTRPGELVALAERAVALTRANDEDPAEVIEDLRRLAFARWGQGDLAGATARLREAVALARRLPAGSLGGWLVLWNLGQVLERQGAPGEAEALYEESLAVLEAGHGGEAQRRGVSEALSALRARRGASIAGAGPDAADPRSQAADLRARGEAANAAERWAEALPLLEQAYASYRQLTGGDSEEIMELAGALRDALMGLARWPEAMARAEEALALARARPAAPPRLLHHLRAAAEAAVHHARRGGPPAVGRQAEALAREVVEQGRAIDPGDRAKGAYDLRVHAVTLHICGRAAEGVEVARRALALAREAGLQGEEDLGVYERDLISLLEEAGRPAEALPLAREREVRLGRAARGSDAHLAALERVATFEESTLGFGSGLETLRRGQRLCLERHRDADRCDDPWADGIAEALGQSGRSAEALAVTGAILDRHARQGRVDAGDSTRHGLASVYAFNLGDAARATRHARAQLPAARAAGQKGWDLPDAACRAAGNLGGLGLAEESAAAAIEGWEAARELPVAAGDVEWAVKTLVCLAWQARYRGVTDRIDPRAVVARSERLLAEAGVRAPASRVRLLQLRVQLASSDGERDALVAEAEALRAEAPDQAAWLDSLLEDQWRRRGEWERVLPPARARAELFRKTAGAGSRYYGVALQDLGDVLMLLGRVGEAVPIYQEALAIEVGGLRTNLAVLSEKGMTSALWAELSLTRSLVEAALVDPRHAPVAARAVLASRGRVFDALAGSASMTAARARDPRLAPLAEALRVARQERADLALRPPAGLSAKALEREKARLARETSRLEAELRARIPAAARPPDEPSAEAVARRLPPGSAFVDLYRFGGADRGSRSGASEEPRYVAFVYRRGAPPALVDLGPAAELDGAVDELRRAVTTAERRLARADDPADAERELEAEYRAAAAGLYALAVAPLEPALAGARRLFVAPDGALARVPFEALVATEDGPYLVEGREFALLTSARDLLRPPRQGHARGAAVIAGPDFDLMPEARRGRAGAGALLAAAAQDAGRGPVVRAVDLRGGKWDALAGAAAEAGDVETTLGRSRYGPVRTYSGADADEALLKTLPAPRVLHVATHGFFLPVEREEDGGDEAGGLASGAVRGSARLRREANPMLRSGLVLSGANAVGMEGSEGLEDGWLTAEEVSLLDLAGTELVVLSACETGLGEVAAGTGVRGLRSAFLKAGARTLVTSLYKVPDAETRSLMRAFYGGLARGQGKLEALRSAELEAIAERRARVGAAHPLFWGAFVLVGDAG